MYVYMDKLLAILYIYVHQSSFPLKNYSKELKTLDYIFSPAITFQLPAARFCKAPAAPSRVSGLEHSESSVR